jgi:hypothetical protein
MISEAMRRKRSSHSLRFLLIFPAVFFLFASFCPGGGDSDSKLCFLLVKDMADSVDKMKTLRCHIKAVEKVGATYVSAESDIKLNTSPKKLYFKNSTKKIELLYLEGQHSNNALVKPPGFPFTALYLDPNGTLMRKSQHYTIHELGFAFIARTMKSILLRDGDKALKNLSYLGIVKKNGENCHMIMYENKEFGYYDYVVGKSESVALISAKKYLSDYMIRYKNNLHSYYGTIKEGTVMKLPNNYCGKATLFISEKTKMPVAINLYDDKELWESYEYSTIIINKSIPQEEFSRTYKDYHF